MSRATLGGQNVAGQSPGDRAYAVSLHDVAPATWPACERLLSLVDPLGVPVTLLVVPRYHGGTPVDEDPAFASALRARVARGDDVVLHGYFHRDDARPARGPVEWLRRRFYTASEGEFDAIDEPTAARRLAEGRERLTRMGCPPAGFVAPAWLLGAAARRALVHTGLPYTCTQERLERLSDRYCVPAPSLVCSTRAGWRRRASALVIAIRLRTLAGAPLVRVALHPADADHPDIEALWARTLARLAAARRPALERARIL